MSEDDFYEFQHECDAMPDACAVTLLPSSHLRGLTKPANVKED